MTKDKTRFTPSTPVKGASAAIAAARGMGEATGTARATAVSVTPIQDTVPVAPRPRSPAASAILRIDRAIGDLASSAPPGEEVYLDVLDVGSDFEVVRVRESSAEEITFDGLDRRGNPARAVQHYTRLAYFLRTAVPDHARERIGFFFADASASGS